MQLIEKANWMWLFKKMRLNSKLFMMIYAVPFDWKIEEKNTAFDLLLSPPCIHTHIWTRHVLIRHDIKQTEKKTNVETQN